MQLDVHADLPPRSRIVLLRDGGVVTGTHEPHLRYPAAATRSTYRVEVRLPGDAGDMSVPWIVSDPIFVGAPKVASPAVTRPIVAAADVLRPGDAVASWGTEGDPSSPAAVVQDDDSGSRSLVFRVLAWASATAISSPRWWERSRRAS